MKALLLLAGWTAIGSWVAFRGDRTVGERGLALLFWPFFLGQEPPAAGAGLHPSLARLARALGEGDAAEEVVTELSAALYGLSARRHRVQEELTGLGPEEAGDVGDARRRSRGLLTQALAALDGERAQAEAAIEETATLLVLARETGQDEDVGVLLRALRARISAAQELS